MHVAWIGLIASSCFFLLLAITLQALTLTSPEEADKIRDSMRIWFGSAGILGIWIMTAIISLLIFYVPQLITYLKNMSRKADEALAEVKTASQGLQSLTKDVKASANVADTIKSLIETFAKSRAK